MVESVHLAMTDANIAEHIDHQVGEQSIVNELAATAATLGDGVPYLLLGAACQ
jgi:hypothetical protein